MTMARSAAALFLAAGSISAGMAIMVTPLGRTAELWQLPTDLSSALLLTPLFLVYLVVSLALTPPSRRDTRPLHGTARARERREGRRGAPTKLPPSRTSEVWAAAAG